MALSLQYDILSRMQRRNLFAHFALGCSITTRPIPIVRFLRNPRGVYADQQRHRVGIIDDGNTVKAPTHQLPVTERSKPTKEQLNYPLKVAVNDKNKNKQATDKPTG